MARVSPPKVENTLRFNLDDLHVMGLAFTFSVPSGSFDVVKTIQAP